MSTRAIIARSTGPGRFSGRYHHYDGYPSGLGKALWTLAQPSGPFSGNVDTMLRTLVDEHPAGWSTIIGIDWTRPIGYRPPAPAPDKMLPYGAPTADIVAEITRRREQSGPVCYCHGANNEQSSEPLTGHGECCTEYTYVIDATNRAMAIYFAATERLMGLVPLDGPEPDWAEIERTPDPSIWSVFAEPEQ